MRLESVWCVGRAGERVSSVDGAAVDVIHGAVLNEHFSLASQHTSAVCSPGVPGGPSGCARYVVDVPLPDSFRDRRPDHTEEEGDRN